jgi:hypothetical protein
VAVLLLKPPHGYRFITVICNGNGHSPTDVSVRSGVTVM